ncbi:hypothetical protein ColKHC_03987 [Colletotrichum higginsianum]|nr:hypothetical protein ColKHC_03987 [Colletotrichum higginsianum]
MPADGVAREQVREEARNIAKPIRLVAMDLTVVVGERLLKQAGPQPVQLGEALANQAVELGKGLLLRADLDNHRRKFWFLSGREVDSQELVYGFLGVDGRHDCQVDDIEAVLHVDLSVEVDHVCDLVLLFHQVQLLLDGWVVLEAVLPDLEEDLDHVLHALVDVGLVQHVPQLVPDSQGDSGLHVLQMLANLAHEVDSNLDAVVGRLVEEEKEHLAGKAFVGDLVIDEMGQEGGGRDADGLVAALEALAEGYDEALDKELADGRQFRVDDGGHGGEDGSEGQRGGLCLHDGATEQAAALDQVLAKQLGDDVLDVGVVDLVDQTVDALLQGLPHQPLILLGALVRDLGLQRPQPGGRDVCASGPHGQQLLVLGLCDGLLLLLRLDGRRRAALFFAGRPIAVGAITIAIAVSVSVAVSVAGALAVAVVRTVAGVAVAFQIAIAFAALEARRANVCRCHRASQSVSPQSTYQRFGIAWW